MSRFDVAVWQSIRLDYEAGILTDREIGKKHGCSHTAVGKKAKAEGWTRNLTSRIHAKADEKVAKVVVATTVASKSHGYDLATDAAVTAENDLESNPLRLVESIRNQLIRALRDVMRIERQLRQIGACGNGKTESMSEPRTR